MKFSNEARNTVKIVSNSFKTDRFTSTEVASKPCIIACICVLPSLEFLPTVADRSSIEVVNSLRMMHLVSLTLTDESSLLKPFSPSMR